MNTNDRNKTEELQHENKQQQIAIFLESFFHNNYLLRYNVMTQQEEYCLKPPENDENPRQNQLWAPLTERVLNRMIHEQMRQGCDSWGVDVHRYVHSTLIPDHNPVVAYLRELPPWNRKYDYIGSYARRIITSFTAFEPLFHRWFLAMVAQWMGLSHNHGNAQILMLIGPQGLFKSTFCKNILPPCLQTYYMDDIKMNNPEQAERVLCRMALVNIDEYNAKTDREQAKIKRLLTERDVQVRPMRSSEYTLLRRMASFTATTNDMHPLCDPTGSRRYLCVPVEGCIQMKRPVLYSKMYAQAVYELEHGARYWLDRREERLLTKHNQQFQRPASADETVLSIFRPARRDVTHLMRAVDMQKVMRSHLAAADVPGIRLLTTVLARNRFLYGAHHGIRGWYAELVEKEPAT